MRARSPNRTRSSVFPLSPFSPHILTSLKTSRWWQLLSNEDECLLVVFISCLPPLSSLFLSSSATRVYFTVCNNYNRSHLTFVWKEPVVERFNIVNPQLGVDFRFPESLESSVREINERNRKSWKNEEACRIKGLKESGWLLSDTFRGNPLRWAHVHREPAQSGHNDNTGFDP